VARSDAYEGGFWVLNRYEDVLKVAQDWESFSFGAGDHGAVPAAEDRHEDLPVAVDPPLQREFKRLVNAHFTPEKVGPWEAPTRALVNSLIDGFIERGECDFMTEFAGRCQAWPSLSSRCTPRPRTAQVNNWATKASLPQEQGRARVDHEARRVDRPVHRPP